MTHDEALEFIDKKRQLLDLKARSLTEESSKLKANIKLVLQSLSEIQNLSGIQPKKDVYDPLS